MIYNIMQALCSVLAIRTPHHTHAEDLAIKKGGSYGYMVGILD